jgi:hypothetical protein
MIAPAIKFIMFFVIAGAGCLFLGPIMIRHHRDWATPPFAKFDEQRWLASGVIALIVGVFFSHSLYLY